jgi:hypothetical protein
VEDDLVELFHQAILGVPGGDMCHTLEVSANLEISDDSVVLGRISFDLDSDCSDE